VANNESTEVVGIIKPGQRVELKVTGSKMSTTSDDLLFAHWWAGIKSAACQPLLVLLAMEYKVSSENSIRRAG